ncbi:MAG: pitrilysin family protein, partial [Pseudomonadota bacterium]|nr:pitrilysin family protein [Pseudomonadota bacterium]
GNGYAAVFSPKSFVLDNGLRVVVIENHRAPIVMQMLWYRVGAADEEPGESGLAHFLEHLLFKGTKTTAPGEFSRTISRIGGEDNAFTSYDFTAYFQRVAANELETVMRLEADRMENLALTDEVVSTERDVVREERRSRTDNSPAAQLREQVRRVLYLNHPYGRPVIGWMNEIDKLTTEKALAFYRKHYSPSNAMLIIAGDVSLDRVRKLAKKYYGPIPGRAVPPRVRPKEPPHRASRRVELRNARIKLPAISRTYLAPSYSTGKNKIAYPLEVLAQVLGGGTTSLLYRKLVVELGIASSAGAWYSGDGLDYGEFGIYASPRAGGNIVALEKALFHELRVGIEEGFKIQEIERAKKLIAAQAIYARDGLTAGPNAIGQAFTQGQTIADVEAWPDRIAAVTVDQVVEAARTVFDVKRSVTSVLLPKGDR